LIGSVLTLQIGMPAAGGHCVAHHQGATVFVRGSLPDERVRARVEASVRGGRVLFAMVVEVLEPSPSRVTPPCGYADDCGGCDLQHVESDVQRDWKRRVLVDQLRTIGGVGEIAGVPLARALDVVAVGPGLGWRTRVSVGVENGRAGFHRHRSEQVVPVSNCLVCSPELAAIFAEEWPGIDKVVASTGDPGGYLSHSPARVPAKGRVGDLTPRAWVARTAAGRSWRVATDGFWQAHREAPDVLVAAVDQALSPRADDHLWDLYSGVGLFAGAMAARVARVDAVEGDAVAARLARRNLHDLPQVRIHQQPVAQWLGQDHGCPTIVVLDPPRAGAGAEVVGRISESTATRLAYVACDGAALARDLKSLLAAGWRLDSLAAFDLFPMTQHVEAVAGLTRTVTSAS
jgi:tRNA/tmRNA/rRNA uracil-C5-methylase (TrmA/RlmC/RlmD family)